MTYKKRLTLLILLDTLIVSSSIVASTYLVYSETINWLPILITSAILLVSHHILAVCFGLYRKAWEYASIGELLTIFNVVGLSISVAAIGQFVVLDQIMLRALFATFMLHILLIGGSRFAWRVFRDRILTRVSNKKRTLIIGAGAGGVMVARQLADSRESELKPVVFVDDDPKKKRVQILSVPVAGKLDDIERVVEKYRIEHIIFAIPSISKTRANEVYQLCSKTGVKTQTIPKFEDLVTGKVSVTELRDVDIEDLLGREPVELDMQKIGNNIRNKTVLITGAGGSIGSEICRQIAKFGPNQLLLLGHGENSIYQIERELRGKINGKIDIKPIIADVQDRKRIGEVMSTYEPDVVYHAAAHKHVPLMEFNPIEAVKNNIIGTKNVAEAADHFRVETFVLVSTDKAVNPTNVMGATKRVAEMIIQNLAQHSATKFCAVRFGNVLGSRGSVIPLFKEQIAKGGPVTVTHPEMTRYFMTIPEASRLVIQAGSLARGGEIFVLDMGKPVKIVDLAKNLIRLTGANEEEVKIEFSGIRPGEKMYEELLGENEVSDEQVFPKIYIGKCTFDEVEGIREQVSDFLELPSTQIKEKLMQTIEPERKKAKEFA
ncbi:MULTISPECIES: nucleoside-diphosphate sugar epimerase/dehydratase [Allobacillus]|uniref:Polysaccharide biosynthesis protein n=1 Tax=Allobacillus salarius TaxID=1955272 RepID=A0A556PMM6_9BACI|nr:nucleoside-diphosphate sugar epimerase/dehydratase [Allobacillus salarius]TSJ65650.1 polysaccharide biosynthesis protein [Allobacillus salarius]